MDKKRNLKDLGENYYDFFWNTEETIYLYVCRKKIKKKNLKKLDTNLKFETHGQWEQYVRNKYDTYSKEKLMDFSRYLNQNLRDIKPDREYWKISIPIVLTLILENFFELIFEICKEQIVSFGDGIARIFATGIVCSYLFVACANLVKNIWSTKEDEYFIIDYKEIINEMIQQ